MTRHRIGTSIGLALFLVLFTSSALLASEPFADGLKAANQLYQQHEFQQAEASYRALVAIAKTPADKGKVVFNLGMCLQALQRYDEAIATYQQIFDLAVNDKEPGGNVMVAYQNYRPRAMWQISECQYSQGQYAKSLASIILTRDQYPLQSWCGNAIAEYQYRYEFHIALCQEQLGRPMQAIKHYYKANAVEMASDPTAAWRLLVLYRNAHQLDDLANLLQQKQDRDLVMYLKNTAREAQHLTTMERQKRLANYVQSEKMSVLASLLDLQKLADKKQWDKLMEILLSRDGYPSSPYLRDVPQMAAAHLLAESTDETLPLLLKAVNDAKKYHVSRWVYYALGLNGSSQAKAALKARLKLEENGNWQCELLYSLALAGEDKRLPWYKALPVKRGFFGVTYPPLPDAKMKLPVKLAEVDDFAAYEAKLPAAVTLELSTPENTVKTMLMSALIDQAEVFNQTLTPSCPFKNARNDIHELAVSGLLHIEAWPASMKDDQTATVISKFSTIKRKDTWITFTLKLGDGKWRIDGASEERQPPEGFDLSVCGRIYP